MPKTYDQETIIKAFALVMDGLSAASASDRLKESATDIEGKFPGKRTIESWASKGELTNGISWYVIRDTAAAIRMVTKTEAVIRTKKKTWDAWLDDTYADLDNLQDILSANIPLMRFGPGDIKHITQTRLALDAASGQRTEQAKGMTTVLGKIVDRAFRMSAARFPANETIIGVLEDTMRSIQEEFMTYLSLGCPEDYEVGTHVTVRQSTDRGVAQRNQLPG